MRKRGKTMEKYQLKLGDDLKKMNEEVIQQVQEEIIEITENSDCMLAVGLEQVDLNAGDYATSVSRDDGELNTKQDKQLEGTNNGNSDNDTYEAVIRTQYGDLNNIIDNIESKIPEQNGYSTMSEFYVNTLGNNEGFQYEG